MVGGSTDGCLHTEQSKDHGSIGRKVDDSGGAMVKGNGDVQPEVVQVEEDGRVEDEMIHDGGWNAHDEHLIREKDDIGLVTHNLMTFWRGKIRNLDDPE